MPGCRGRDAAIRRTDPGALSVPFGPRYGSSVELILQEGKARPLENFFGEGEPEKRFRDIFFSMTGNLTSEDAVL